FYRFPYNKVPRITGEKSVSYLYRPWVNHVIKNIKAIHPLGKFLKIILILRQPVDRIYSQYIFNTRNNEQLPFNQAIKAWPQRKAQSWVPAYDYIGASYYAEAVKAYLESFSYVKVVLFDDLKSNPQEMLKEIYRFLAITSDFIPQRLGESFNFSGLPNNSMMGKIYNQHWIRKIIRPLKNTLPNDIIEKIALSMKSKAVCKPELDIETRSELTELFREDIRKLEKIINRDLSHWLT
ncbi:MAG: sulfotransferase domain-containing protein, partial [Bacteroidales bacterium]|nr:sulfotransferase domain-containing protein [Bacteroidales bacterium]